MVSKNTMAAFFRNECPEKFCGKVFHTLADLIVHRERNHLDFSPYTQQKLEEERPELVPMSYVLKFSKPDEPEPLSVVENRTDFNDPFMSHIPTLSEICKYASTHNNNLYDFGSNEKQMDGSMTFDGKLCDALFNPDFLMHLDCKIYTLDTTHKKPFGCNIPGCNKRYKNINGLKYHCKNFHNLYTPAFKKSSIPKTKSNSRAKSLKSEFKASPLNNLKPPVQPQTFYDEVMYRNMQKLEPPEGNFYKESCAFPGPSTSHCNFEAQSSNVVFHKLSELSEQL